MQPGCCAFLFALADHLSKICQNYVYKKVDFNKQIFSLVSLLATLFALCVCYVFSLWQLDFSLAGVLTK